MSHKRDIVFDENSGFTASSFPSQMDVAVAIYLGNLWRVLTWIKAFLGKISLLNYTFWVDLGWGDYKFNEFVTCQGTEGVDRQADHQKSWRSTGHLPTSFHHGKTTPCQNMSKHLIKNPITSEFPCFEPKYHVWTTISLDISYLTPEDFRPTKMDHQNPQGLFHLWSKQLVQSTTQGQLPRPWHKSLQHQRPWPQGGCKKKRVKT